MLVNKDIVISYGTKEEKKKIKNTFTPPFSLVQIQHIKFKIFHGLKSYNLEYPRIC